MSNPSVMPPVGWDPDGLRIEVELYNRSGATTGIGEIVMVDIGATATEATALAVAGGSDSPWANYVDPDVTLTTYGAAGIFAIALEAITDNSKGKCLLRGLSTVTKVAAATAIGTALVPNADGEMDVAATSKIKIVGIALDADTSNYSTVYFDGINGIGLDHD